MLLKGDLSQTTHRDIALFPLQTLSYPYPISTVFSSLTEESLKSQKQSRRSSVSSTPQVQNGVTTGDQILETLRVVDYRYSRFALDPRTGLFGMTRLIFLPATVFATSYRFTNMHTEIGVIRRGLGYLPFKEEY